MVFLHTVNSATTLVTSFNAINDETNRSKFLTIVMENIEDSEMMARKLNSERVLRALLRDSFVNGDSLNVVNIRRFAMVFMAMGSENFCPYASACMKRVLKSLGMRSFKVEDMGSINVKQASFVNEYLTALRDNDVETFTVLFRGKNPQYFKWSASLTFFLGYPLSVLRSLVEKSWLEDLSESVLKEIVTLFWSIVNWVKFSATLVYMGTIAITFITTTLTKMNLLEGALACIVMTRSIITAIIPWELRFRLSGISSSVVYRDMSISVIEIFLVAEVVLLFPTAKFIKEAIKDFIENRRAYQRFMLFHKGDTRFIEIPVVKGDEKCDDSVTTASVLTTSSLKDLNKKFKATNIRLQKKKEKRKVIPEAPKAPVEKLWMASAYMEDVEVVFDDMIQTAGSNAAMLSQDSSMGSPTATVRERNVEEYRIHPNPAVEEPAPSDEDEAAVLDEPTAPITENDILQGFTTEQAEIILKGEEVESGVMESAEARRRNALVKRKIRKGKAKKELIKKDMRK
jgi:hypothetical protein